MNSNQRIERTVAPRLDFKCAELIERWVRSLCLVAVPVGRLYRKAAKLA